MTFFLPYSKVGMLLQLLSAYMAQAYTRECLRQNNMQSRFVSLQNGKDGDPKAT